MDEEGLVVDRGKIDKFYLPPQEKFIFTIKLPVNLESVNYTAILTFNLEEGDALVREIDFSKDSSGVISVHDIRE